MLARLTVLTLALTAAPLVAADEYQVDTTHAAVTFKVSHFGLSWTHGRFKDVSGTFTVDSANPSASAFALTIKAESIDTDNAQRDGHLKSPDFFNVKQFPAITFKSTSVKPIKDGLEVTGNFTMHGVTKTITFPLLGGKTAEFPKGTKRTGYTTELVLKRSDYGMGKMVEAIGDEVAVAISFEGVKK